VHLLTLSNSASGGAPVAGLFSSPSTSTQSAGGSSSGASGSSATKKTKSPFEQRASLLVALHSFLAVMMREIDSDKPVDSVAIHQHAWQPAYQVGCVLA